MRYLKLTLLILLWAIVPFAPVALDADPIWQLPAGALFVILGLIILRALEPDFFDPNFWLSHGGWKGLISAVLVLAGGLAVLVALWYPLIFLVPGEWFGLGCGIGFVLYIALARAVGSGKSTPS